MRKILFLAFSFFIYLTSTNNAHAAAAAAGSSGRFFDSETYDAAHRKVSVTLATPRNLGRLYEIGEANMKTPGSKMVKSTTVEIEGTFSLGLSYKYEGKTPEGTISHYCIEDNETNKIVGYILLGKIIGQPPKYEALKSLEGRVDVSTVIDPEYRRKGFSSAARVVLIEDILPSIMTDKRVKGLVSFVSVDNNPQRRFFKKLGIPPYDFFFGTLHNTKGSPDIAYPFPPICPAKLERETIDLIEKGGDAAVSELTRLSGYQVSAPITMAEILAALTRAKLI